MKAIVFTDIESSDTSRANNGGNYDYGRTVIVMDEKIIGGRYWTSADFGYCHICGTFGNCDCQDGDTWYERSADIAALEARIDAGDGEIVEFHGPFAPVAGREEIFSLSTAAQALISKRIGFGDFKRIVKAL